MADSSIILKDLTIGYNSRQSKKLLLGNLNATLKAGETVALIGSNGCGKSTLLRTISGFQKSLSGDVILNGKNISSISIKDKAKLISFVSTEIIRVSNMTVYDLIRLGRYLYSDWWGGLSPEDSEAIEHCINITGLEGFENRLLESLSDGERQRAMIARALAQDTPVLILDEPTAFLDIRNKYEIIHLLNGLASDHHKIIIFSTHDFNIALGMSDKIWYIKDKKLCDGAPEDMALNGDFESMFEGSAIKFQPESGDFIIENGNELKVQLYAEEKIKFWLLKALKRNGFSEDTVSPIKISTFISGGNTEYIIYHAGKSINFSSVYELIKYLKFIR